MNLRIHGDNILECEHALRLVADAFALDGELVVRLADSPLWAPMYEFIRKDSVLVRAQLIPGYGRWPFDVQKELRKRGAPLREKIDAIVTELRDEGGEICEEPIITFEFCGALPAGNNAWQRCGRCLNSAYAGIPYLYFAELGGAELDAKRQVKAGRKPNPIIPFAYMAVGDTLKTVALPVFLPSPSIQDGEREAFAGAFGSGDAAALVRSILSHGFNSGEEKDLRKKAIRAVAALVKMRRRKDTLTDEEWQELAAAASGRKKGDWLVAKGMAWRKKITIPKTTTLPKLFASIQKLAVGIGTEELPICLVPASRRSALTDVIGKLYGAKIDKDFANWVREEQKHLVIVWIAGFKPRGDDSRPDRGLVPLARMIFGEDDVDVLSIVYGPGRNFATVLENPTEAAETNGLWEAILRFSNAVLIDSPTGAKLQRLSLIVPVQTKAKPAQKPKTPAGASDPVEFGENDVDSALHIIFTRALCDACFECMCNPPGGDWSGFSLRVDDDVLRWTSLPRVTAKLAKRPDHVTQFMSGADVLLAIESKDAARNVETGIGPRLSRYVSSMTAYVPNISRKVNAENWAPTNAVQKVSKRTVISGAAFRCRNEGDLAAVEARSQCDVVFGFEFDVATGKTTLHVKCDGKLRWLVDSLRVAAKELHGRLVIQIH